MPVLSSERGHDIALYDPPIFDPHAVSAEKMKSLVMRFIIASTVIFLVVGALGAILRESQAKIYVIAPQLWYALMTTHGLGAFVGWAAFAFMGLTFWVLHECGLTLGKWGFRFAEACWWTMVVGVAGVVITTISYTVGPSWVALYPLPLHPAGEWSDHAAAAFALSVLVAGLSIFFYCFAVIAAVTGPGLGAPAGMRWWRRLLAGIGLGLLFKGFRTERALPYPVIPFTVIAIDMIIATTPFAILLVLMIIEAFAPSVTVDPVLAKAMLWWFGHPVVYLLLFPAVGIYYHLIPRFAGRPLVAGHVLAVGWAIGVTTNVVIGFHHMYLDFPTTVTQWINTWSQPLTYAVTIPSALSLFSLALTVYKTNFKWTVSGLFLGGAMASWLVAGFQGVMLATISYDVLAHNTLWVVGHFHNMALISLGSVIFAGIYALLPAMTGREWASRNLGIAHWGLTIVGGYGSVVPWMWQGLNGAPRRWAVLPGTSYDMASKAAIPFVLLIALGQACFAVNLARTLGPGWLREQVGAKLPRLASTPGVPRERGKEAVAALVAGLGIALAFIGLFQRPFAWAPAGAALAIVAARTGAPRQGLWALLLAILLLVVGFLFHGFA